MLVLDLGLITDRSELSSLLEERMNSSLEIAEVIQSTIGRLITFPVEMLSETVCWRMRRIRVRNPRAARSMSF